jgi:hypothetical protein
VHNRSRHTFSPNLGSCWADLDFTIMIDEQLICCFLYPRYEWCHPKVKWQDIVHWDEKVVYQADYSKVRS